MRNIRHRLLLGRILMTPGAIAAFEKAGEVPFGYLRRHASGDWGELDDHDKRMNDEAIRHEGDPEKQGRVLSAYVLQHNTKIWIITEHDRSVTTILLPEEY